MSGLKRIPGKPSIWYGVPPVDKLDEGESGGPGIYRWYEVTVPAETKDGKAEKILVLRNLLDWLPRVDRYIVTKDTREKIVTARYTLTIDGHEDTIEAEDLMSAEAWKKWPGAVGIHDRPVRECLAIIVQAMARKRGQTVGAPYWSLKDSELVMPDLDLLPRGYGDRRDRGELGQLVDVAIRNPKLALMMGFSYGAPYLGPLGRSSFWVAPSGTSSKGKTTAALAAGCMHGYAARKGGLIRPWNATAIATTLALSELSVLPAFWDEIHMAGFTPATLKKAIHTTCDGSDRLTATRTRRLREGATWSGVLFSSGNLSISDWCPQPEISARVVEIPTPIVHDGHTAKVVEYLALRNFGWWKPVEIDHMRELIVFAARRIGIPDEGGVAERIVENLAVGVAGALCVGGPLMADSALQAAVDLLSIQLDEMAEVGSTPSEKLLDELRQAIVSRPFKFPTDAEYRDWLRSDRAVHGLEVQGFRTFDVAEPEETALLQVLTKFLPAIARDAGLDNTRIALRELKSSGVLKTGTESAAGKGQRLRKKVTIAGAQRDVYEFDLRHASNISTTARDRDNRDNRESDGEGAGEGAAQTVFGGWPEVIPVALPIPVDRDTHRDADPNRADNPSTWENEFWLDKPDTLASACGAQPGRDGQGRESITVTPVTWENGHNPGIPVDENPGHPSNPGIPVAAVIPVVPAPRSGIGPVAPCAACGNPTSSYVQGVPCCATDCDPPRPTAPAPVQDEIPVAESRASRSVRQRAEFGEQLDHLRRAFAKVDAYPDATEAELTAALKTFSVALDGLSFAGPPSRVGQLLFEKLTAQYGSVPVLGEPPKLVVENPVTMLNLVDQGADANAHQLVVGADVNAQYLAAAVCDLGTGDPMRLGSRPDYAKDLKLPGYVQLGADFEVGPRCVLKAGDWVPNPIAVYLLQRGGLVVADGWVWPERRRWLNLWVSRIRKARADLMARPDLASQMALKAVKAVYAAFLGGYLLSEKYAKDELLRPDWAHMIHGTAAANMHRALDKATVKPFATLVDAAYFLVNDPADLSGLTLSGQPGKWKMHRIGRTADQTWTTRRTRGEEIQTSTTLAEQIGRGQLGNISEAIRHLDEVYNGKVVGV